MNITSLFYAEFEIHIGPKVVFQHPPDSISEHLFNQIQYFVIPESCICSKVCDVRISEEAQ